MDDEITAMFQVAKILEDLDDEGRGRVLRWAADKFDVDLGQPIEVDEGAIEATDETIIGGVDPAKVAARQAQGPKLEVKPASSLDEAEKPPPRDPDKPSFMDTSFRMFSGKQQLKKEKDSDK